jgi:hypothetical protein
MPRHIHMTRHFASENKFGLRHPNGTFFNHANGSRTKGQSLWEPDKCAPSVWLIYLHLLAISRATEHHSEFFRTASTPIIQISRRLSNRRDSMKNRIAIV